MGYSAPALDKDRIMTPTRQRPTHWQWAIVGVLILLFAFYYGLLALQKHDALVTSIDLANANNTLWNTLNGQPFRMTTHGNMSSRLAMHLEPLLLALVPLYALVPSPKTLLLVQAVVLALAAVPLYLLATEALDNAWLALIFPLLYLLSPAVHNAALADFHAVALGVLPALAALLALWRGHTRAALLFAFLALLAREDYGLWLAALAAIGWWRTRNRSSGIGPIWIAVGLFGLAWFAFALLLLAPIFTEGQGSVFWERYRFWLEGPQAWLEQGLLLEKGRYLLLLLLMGGAGALLAPLWILPALPALGLNLLSNYPLPVTLDAYYSVLVFPMLLAASAIGLGAMRSRGLGVRGLAVALVVLLVAALWVHLSEGRSPLVPGFRPPQRTLHSQTLPEVLATLPADAPLSATAAVSPHASGRELIRLFPRRKNAAYAVVDVYQDRTSHPVSARRRLLRLVDGDWGIRAGKHGFLVLEAGGTQADIPAEFYTFARPDGEPQYPVSVVFADTWELQGFDVFWDYWGRPATRLYWRVLAPPDGDWQPAVLGLDPAGRVLATPDTHTPVTLLWLPTSQWQPGQTYVVEMLPFDAGDEVVLVAGVG
ncbi:MAG: DUF2079 domain-containing protein, partial [Anaerolineae bacterium]